MDTVSESVPEEEVVDTNQMTDGTELECTHCGYEWTYSGQLALATCPSCNGKTPVESEESEEPEESEEAKA